MECSRKDPEDFVVRPSNYDSSTFFYEVRGKSF